MTPILITAPTDPVVGLSQLRDHLKMTEGDNDLHITRLERSAVAYLDGWTGVLGRCIMPQTWAVTLPRSGRYVLPMPDVTEAFASYDAEEPLALEKCAAGQVVDLTEEATVTFSCAMPQTLLPSVQIGVMLMVERDYDRPSGPAYDAINRTIQAHIDQVKWRML